MGEFFGFDVVHVEVIDRHADGDPPVFALLDPEFEPHGVVFGGAEPFHFHLLEFAGAEDEIARGDFVAEGFADLRDAEGGFDAHGIEDVFVVGEDALGGFGAQVRFVVFVADDAGEGV